MQNSCTEEEAGEFGDHGWRAWTTESRTVCLLHTQWCTCQSNFLRKSTTCPDLCFRRELTLVEGTIFGASGEAALTGEPRVSRSPASKGEGSGGDLLQGDWPRPPGLTVLESDSSRATAGVRLEGAWGCLC